MTTEKQRRVAIISLHTSPLAQPGVGDSGGMNVYVREMASALAQQGTECVVYTRANAAELPQEVVVEPGHRVVYVQAGPHHLPKEALTDIIDEFTEAVVDDIEARGVANILDLFTATPGMSGFEAPSSRGNVSINLRGVGSGNANSVSTDPANAIYVDGIFLGKSAGHPSGGHFFVRSMPVGTR